MVQKWQKVKINTKSGETVEGVAPIIISASRSTDIPAFHSKWFFNRIKEGYVVWKNPFNNKKSYISFEKTRVIVFWTKNPKPILPYLKYLDEKGINYYFQFTLNNYDKEQLEPNVPNLEKRIDTFIQLSNLIGKEKVIWRFDPLILTNNLTVDKLITKIDNMAQKLVPFTNKLVFSFADILSYKKVQNNLVRKNFVDRNDLILVEFTKQQQLEFAEKLNTLLSDFKKLNPNFKLATCAEDIDLETFNITHNKCIDDDLMIQLFKKDRQLMNFLGYTPNLLPAIGVEPKENENKLKDKGQRKACGCIISKDIGSYNTCNHLCVYCYANTSEKVVKNNLERLQSNSESLL